MPILITGGSGRLGSTLAALLPGALAPSSRELDITKKASIDLFFSAHKITLVIHCAALADVGACEGNPDLAYRLNVQGTVHVYEACRRTGARMLYIGTDHIFDGKRGHYKETDTPHPIGVYAMTKYLAERVVLLNPKNLIVRTSFIKSFPLPKAFSDKYFSGDTVDVIASDIVEAARSRLTGIVHIGGERTSIYEIAKKINPRVGKMKLRDNPITQSGLPYLKDTSLDISKWKKFKKDKK